MKNINFYKIITGMGRRRLLNWIPDKLYLDLAYWSTFKKRIDFNNPKTFNEKLQWLKLYDRKDIYTNLVDKYEVKNFIADNIGEEFVIPTLGVYNSFDEIDFYSLPNQFVIKCTHDSGSAVIVKDKLKIDKATIKKKINKCLKGNGYYYGRERPYKNVKPRIIIEKYMSNNGNDLNDYKLFCFNGRVKCFKIDFNRFKKHQANYYDRNGKILEFGEEALPTDFRRKLEIPQNLKKMIEIAEKLANNIAFVRVDFYNVNDRVYFGEMTFYPAAGFGKLVPEKWDEILGSWIII